MSNDPQTPGALSGMLAEKAGGTSEKDNKDLRELLKRSQGIITKYAAQEVVFSPPLITLGGAVGVIRPRTINLIQGKMGSHKSRLAEYMAALCLSKVGCDTDFLGFARTVNAPPIAVLYIDTERNKTEEFPYAIQNIRRLAGYPKGHELPGLHVWSLKDVPDRKQRLPAVKACVEMSRELLRDQHLVIILDVVTDCIKNYNDESEALHLFDWLGQLCEDQDVTVLGVIHENPGNSENPKARGHAGTEGANKSSCVMQIGFEKEKTNPLKDTDILRIMFLKLRGAARPEALYFRFESGGFSAVDISTATQLAAASRARQDIDVVLQWLGERLGDNQPEGRKALLESYRKQFDCVEKTAEVRLDDIIKEKLHIYDNFGKQCYLVKENAAKGNVKVYILKRVYAEDEPQLSIVVEAEKVAEMAAAAAAPKDDTAPF